VKRRPDNHKSHSHIVTLVPNKTMRIMLRVLLQKAGYSVSEAENKRQAVNLLFDVRPNVLVVDYEAPNLEAEMSIQLHEDARSLNIPLVALIGRDMEREPHKAHADSYLLKPLQMDELFQAIADSKH
jgi:CheY-like chemotaxis protein